MDVLYYWKDCADDMKAGKIGWFRSEQEKLTELAAGYPDMIWVVKTPAGHKGELQLKGCLHWCDKPAVAMPKLEGKSAMFYDPQSARSIWFLDEAQSRTRSAVSAWMQRHFSAAIRGNFQGKNGQHALRGAQLNELKAIAASMASQPFTEVLKQIKEPA